MTRIESSARDYAIASLSSVDLSPLDALQAVMRLDGFGCWLEINNAAGYTTMPWDALCEAVGCVELPHNPPAQPGGLGEDSPVFQAVGERGGRDLNPRKRRARG